MPRHFSLPASPPSWLPIPRLSTGTATRLPGDPRPRRPSPRRVTWLPLPLGLWDSGERSPRSSFSSGEGIIRPWGKCRIQHRLRFLRRGFLQLCPDFAARLNSCRQSTCRACLSSTVFTQAPQGDDQFCRAAIAPFSQPHEPHSADPAMVHRRAPANLPPRATQPTHKHHAAAPPPSRPNPESPPYPPPTGATRQTPKLGPPVS